jgi:predicted CoA-binding protein
MPRDPIVDEVRVFANTRLPSTISMSKRSSPLPRNVNAVPSIQLFPLCLRRRVPNPNAQSPRRVGPAVVMDRCILKDHRRLAYAS